MFEVCGTRRGRLGSGAPLVVQATVVAAGCGYRIFTLPYRWHHAPKGAAIGAAQRAPKSSPDDEQDQHPRDGGRYRPGRALANGEGQDRKSQGREHKPPPMCFASQMLGP